MHDLIVEAIGILPAGTRKTKHERRQLLAAVLLILIPAGGSAATGDDGLNPDVVLQALLEEAQANNPGLQALRHRAAAARERIPQAGALPDPSAGLALVNLPVESLSLDDTPMTGLELRWMQSFPWPGTRSLREDVAAQSARSSDYEVAEAEVQLVGQVKSTWYEIFFLDRALEIVHRNRDLLSDVARISEERYAVGKGVQADVTRAQVALSRELARISRLESQRAGLSARLAGLLGREGDGEVSTPDRLAHVQLALATRNLLQLALDHRPLIAQLQVELEAARSREAVARRELRPDISTGLSYRLREDLPGDPVEGEDFVGASVMLRLPVFSRNKQKRQIAERREQVWQAEARLEDARLRTFAAIREIDAGLKGIQREIELYENGILVQAEQSWESSRTAYEVDQLEFLSFLDAHVTLLQEEIRYWRLRADYYKAMARLESEVGMPLPKQPAEEVGR